MIYGVLMFLLFVDGAAIGVVAGYFIWGKPKPAVQPAEDRTEEELEKARKEREELIASQKAFQRMMGYNADIAYGVEEDDLTAGGI